MPPETPKQYKTTRCPVCAKRVAIAQHPNPAWRSMRRHTDPEGRACQGSSRGKEEARLWVLAGVTNA